MKLSIVVTLDSGGTVKIEGEDLTAEDVNEVFAILSGYDVESTVDREPIDQPLPVTESMRDSFVEGFREGRTEKEEENT